MKRIYCGINRRDFNVIVDSFTSLLCYSFMPAAACELSWFIDYSTKCSAVCHRHSIGMWCRDNFYDEGE